MDNPNFEKYPVLAASFENKVPLLWTSKEWAAEFATFIEDLVGENPSPEIIEIHPPFRSYSGTDTFLDIYSLFEERILSVYPNTILFIENRSGSERKKDSFLLSSADDLIELCEKVVRIGLSLRLTLDIPQLLTTHRTMVKTKAEQVDVLLRMLPVRDRIRGIHLWGKSPSAHMGDLNTTFRGDAAIKQRFLDNMVTVFDDEQKRYFVPEVNSSPLHLHSIVADIQDAGFIFV